MKVSDLPVEQLDYWVARAKGVNTFSTDGGRTLSYVPAPSLAPRKWNPTRFWSQGGPIIEEVRIDLNWDTEGTQEWSASIDPNILTHGKTVLEAAMRAFITLSFGEELPVGA